MTVENRHMRFLDVISDSNAQIRDYHEYSLLNDTQFAYLVSTYTRIDMRNFETYAIGWACLQIC